MKLGTSKLLVMVESQFFGYWVEFERLKLGFSSGEKEKVKSYLDGRVWF